MSPVGFLVCSVHSFVSKNLFTLTMDEAWITLASVYLVIDMRLLCLTLEPSSRQLSRGLDHFPFFSPIF